MEEVAGKLTEIFMGYPPEVRGAALGVVNAAAYHLVTGLLQTARNRLLRGKHINKIAHDIGASPEEIQEQYQEGGQTGNFPERLVYQGVNDAVRSDNEGDLIGMTTGGAAAALNAVYGFTGLLDGTPVPIIAGFIGILAGPLLRFGAKALLNKLRGY